MHISELQASKRVVVSSVLVLACIVTLGSRSRGAIGQFAAR